MQDRFLNGTASVYMWRISHEQKQTLTAEIQNWKCLHLSPLESTPTIEKLSIVIIWGT